MSQIVLPLIDSIRPYYDRAVISHYIHHCNSEIGEHYKKKALEILERNINLEFPTIDSWIKALKKEHNKPTFPHKKKTSFTFIDLFAGIGGFRMALQNLGGQCVFTSEWDRDAQNTYQNNYGEYPFGDITLPETKAAIPEKFDALCAGFPCQPFSKGGFQGGFEDTRGTLFFDLCEIITKHKPKYLFLENVANLVSHDKGNTYQVILKSLDELGYYFPEEHIIISPDKFGVPILRPRVYIPAVRKDIADNNTEVIKNFKVILESSYTKKIASIDTVLDTTIEDNLTEYEERVLNMWDEFYKGIDLKIIGFPIWVDFFKHEKNLSQYPNWKAKFIQKNRDLYNRNKEFIDAWLKKHKQLDWCIPTHRKMEWQAGDKYTSLFDCLIQFRPSGVRIKRPDKFSTLVAMNHRQIIGKLKRKISIGESKALQSFPENYQLSKTNAVAMKQLGNSVNVKVIQEIFKTVLTHYS
jgi:DNA (cytosine-5)-methyltransferase 1